MIRFLPMAIGLMVVTSVVLNSHGAAVLSQTPEAQPETSPSPEGQDVPSESNSPESNSSESSPPEPSSTETTPADYQVIATDDWSFAVPPGWQNLLSEPVDLGDDTSLVAQVTDDQKQTIVNLVIQEYKGDNNDYIDQSVETLAELGTIHTQDPITLSDWQGVAVDFSLASNEPPTRFLQHVIAANGTGFALTCGGREETFAASQPICTTILNSLQIPPP